MEKGVEELSEDKLKEILTKKGLSAEEVSAPRDGEGLYCPPIPSPKRGECMS
jgi:hypothetical protein